MGPIAITIRKNDREQISILVKEHEETYNVVSCEISVSADKLRCNTLTADFRVETFSKFREQLELLYKELKGQAVLEDLEKRLTLHVKSKELGHINVTGEVGDTSLLQANRLHFGFNIDQTYLNGLISQLRKLEALYPKQS